MLNEAADRVVLAAPMLGTVVSVDTAPGAIVRVGATLVVLDAMKMEHPIDAPCDGTIVEVLVAVGSTVEEGQALVVVARGIVAPTVAAASAVIDPTAVRADLAEVLDRQARTLDAARPESVARRRARSQRSARENIDDLVDVGSFVEYGSLTIAAQRRRRSVDDLIENTPADGLVGGLASINGDRFAHDVSRCVVVSYDFTVLAGTQGTNNHRKKDRLFTLAARLRLPLVIFAEGGGGRPGDTDGVQFAGLDGPAFALYGQLSGLVPLIAIVSGRCFAGNAALAGCSDVIIATKDANLGMAGPAMIEGGGLGVFAPEDIGPMSVQHANGVVDVVVDDEAAAVQVAKQYLSYFQGSVADWTCADQQLLRSAIPENRLRAYDIRRVIDLLADDDSVLELRRPFGRGMVTCFARIEGRPIGIVANDPSYLAGAIDSDNADKAARFLQLCDAHDIPVLFLCDTPGIMVGPDAEATALVRHAARLFVTAGSLTVPFFTIVLRKGYGLGAMTMAGGGFHETIFTVSWPTGEFGGMGLEGAVRLGYRKELAAIADDDERDVAFEAMVAKMYEAGKGVSAAMHFEIDDVIDPAESRRMIMRALRSVPPTPSRAGKKRPCIDTW
jgi:acetyl-CoA carboxylase carboxyltransferase component